MSDDLVVGRINFLTNEPLQVSLGGTPFNKAHLDARAAEIKRLETALSEARAEIEEWRQAASVEAGLRREFFTRAEKAESELSTLRARVREVVGPFAEQADGARLCGAELDDDWKPFLHRSYTDVDITNGHLRAARQLMEEVK